MLSVTAGCSFTSYPGQQKEFAPFGGNFFPLRVNPFFRRGLVCKKANGSSKVVSFLKMGKRQPNISSLLKPYENTNSKVSFYCALESIHCDYLINLYTLMAISADDKLIIFFLFFQENKF